MFLYNEDRKNRDFFITIPEKIKYNFEFLNSITELMEKAMNSECNKIYLTGNVPSIDLNKMSAAYLYTTLIFLTKKENSICK